MNEPRPVRPSCPYTPAFCAVASIALWFLFVAVVLTLGGWRRDLREFVWPTTGVLLGVSLLLLSKRLRWRGE